MWSGPNINRTFLLHPKSNLDAANVRYVACHLNCTLQRQVRLCLKERDHSFCISLFIFGPLKSLQTSRD